MRTQDALDFFGTKTAVAGVLGITRGAVQQWGDVVPLDRAVMLEKATFGKVKVDLGLYDKGGRPIV